MGGRKRSDCPDQRGLLGNKADIRSGVITEIPVGKTSHSFDDL